MLGGGHADDLGPRRARAACRARPRSTRDALRAQQLARGARRPAARTRVTGAVLAAEHLLERAAGRAARRARSRRRRRRSARPRTAGGSRRARRARARPAARSRSRIQRMPGGSSPFVGLVEDQHLGVAEQRGGDRQPLAHAHRVALRRAGRRRRSGRPASSTSSTRATRDGRPRRRARAGGCAPLRPGWKLACSSTAPTLRARVVELARSARPSNVAAPRVGADRGPSSIAQRRALAGAVRAEEAGHPAARRR